MQVQLFSSSFLEVRPKWEVILSKTFELTVTFAYPDESHFASKEPIKPAATVFCDLGHTILPAASLYSTAIQLRLVSFQYWYTSNSTVAPFFDTTLMGTELGRYGPTRDTSMASRSTHRVADTVVGLIVGRMLGCNVDSVEGLGVGLADGRGIGRCDGTVVGIALCTFVGDTVGACVGTRNGAREGTRVGRGVGFLVGIFIV